MPATIGPKCLQAIYEWGLSYSRLASELARPREGRAAAVAVDMHFGDVAKALAELVGECKVARAPGGGRAARQVVDFDTEVLTGWLADIRKKMPDQDTQQVLDNLDELAYEVKHNYLVGVGGEDWAMDGWRRPRRVAIGVDHG
jgi:hypothetical protein